MSKRDYITVEELNFYISNVFQAEELLHNVPVVGEVSGVSVVGGHCYFTLKDKKAQIKVCLFNCEGKYVPHNGAKVLVRGSVDYYQKGGQISVKAYEVVYFGAGLLHIQFEQLKEKLEQEGLFREDHKKPLPQFPKRVALITSVKGAAVQDFITTVRRYNTFTDISIIDVRVQGENCVNDIITALINTDNYGYDVIVLARGGGSYEDLFCFNDEQLVRTVYNLNTPIISAIGHETDYTLCDFVSDYRAITPTAAAEIIGFSVDNIREKIIFNVRKIANILTKQVDDTIDEFCDIAEDMQHNAELIIYERYNYILKLCEKIKIYENSVFERENLKIRHLISNIDNLSPIKLLKQGYFRILKDGVYIENLKNIKINDDIKILGSDGQIEARVKSIRRDNEVRN